MPRYKPLPLNDRKSLFDQLGRYDVKQVVLTGGEPLVDPALPQLIAHAHGAFRTFLFTNALLLPRKAHAVLPHVDRISFSLDGPSEAANAQARRAGHFQKVLQSIAILRDEWPGIEVQVLTVVTKLNQRSLGDIGALLLSLRLGDRLRWKLNFCRNMGQFHRAFALPYREFEGIAADIATSFRGRLRVRYSVAQHDGAYLFVLADGTMYTPIRRQYRFVGDLRHPATFDSERLAVIARRMRQRDLLLSRQETGR